MNRLNEIKLLLIKNRKTLISLAVAFFVLAGNAHGQTTCADHMPFDPPSDRDVLIALYCATGGASWGDNTNWLTDSRFMIGTV